MKDARALVISAALICWLAACGPTTRRADLVIRNSRLWMGDGRVVEVGSIVVEQGRVVAVTGDAGAWEGQVEIDGAGRTVLPGLIDTHVHLLALVSESAEAVARHRREQLSSVLSAFLARGITTVRSTGDPLPMIAEVRDELRSGSLAGPRLLFSGPVLTAKNGHPAVTVCGGGGWVWCRENVVRELEDAAQGRRAVAQLTEQGVDFIKVVYENRLGAQLDFAILEAIVQEARSQGLKVFAHAIPFEPAMEAIEAGVDGLVHFPFGFVDPKVVIAGLGDLPVTSTLGIHTPVRDEEGILRGPYGGEWNDRRGELREAVLRAAGALWQARGRLAFGTDTQMFPPEQSWAHEAQTLLDAGLTPADVLISATRNAAAVIGLEEELGTIEIGKRADLVMVEGRPDEDLDALDHVAMVIQNGVVVVGRP